MNFEIVEGDPSSPYVIHVPHAATSIPGDVRGALLLDGEALAVELRHMTDAHTDVLARSAAERARMRPWLFVNRLSRLVVDPERFPDEREPMERVGMGAVYRRTSHGLVLRDDDLPAKDLLETFFTPYAEALADLVDERLSATYRAVLIDLHSYPVLALPYELHQHARRPEVCLGVDPGHTPPALVQRASAALSAIGEVIIDEPFVGTYVPLRHHHHDNRVASVMVELRRDTYLRQDGTLDPAKADRVTSALVQLLHD